ncbi:unnamed protein product [Discula destructiva]
MALDAQGSSYLGVAAFLYTFVGLMVASKKYRQLKRARYPWFLDPDDCCFFPAAFVPAFVLWPLIVLYATVAGLVECLASKETLCGVSLRRRTAGVAAAAAAGEGLDPEQAAQTGVELTQPRPEGMAMPEEALSDHNDCDSGPKKWPSSGLLRAGRGGDLPPAYGV